MQKFLEKCEKMSNELVGSNFSFVEKVTDLLGKMPIYLALPTAFFFAAFWILIAMPLTLLVHLFLILLEIIDECRCWFGFEGDSLLEKMAVPFYVLFILVFLLVGFLTMRVMACIWAFGAALKLGDYAPIQANTI